jgi:hypothetical protein
MATASAETVGPEADGLAVILQCLSDRMVRNAG